MYIIAAILIFGVLIAVHELGHFLAAKACGVRVNEFSIGMGPAIFHTTKGETEYSLRLLPIGGFCAMEGEDEESDDPRALERQGFWKKLLIFVAGAAMNFLTGLLIMICLYAGAQGFYTAEIVELDSAFPQQGENGIMVGDVIWAINGERIYLKSDVSTVLGVVDLDENGTIEMTVKRGGEKLKRTLTLQTYTDENGAEVRRYGFTYGGIVEATPLVRLQYSWYNTLDFVRLVRMSLMMLVSGSAGLDDLSGPVGIVSTIKDVGEEAQEEADAVRNIISGHTLKMEGRVKREETARQKSIDLTMEKNNLDSRIHLLSEMEKEYEGFNKAVRLIMQAAEKNALRGVHGPVANLMTTDKRYAVAIEIALGAGMQNVVVDREEDAKSAINFLKQRDGGRATFLPLTAIRGDVLREAGVEREYGYVGVASQLVQFDQRYTEIFNNLLGRTVVVEDMDCGIAIARKYSNRFRIVTLDGQVLNRGGSMTGGSVSRSAGILSRANELKELTARREALTEKLDAALREADEAKRDLNAAQYELDVAREQQRGAEDAVLRLTGEKKQYDMLLESLRTRESDIAAELESITARTEELKKAAAAREEEIKKHEAEAARCRAESEEKLAGQNELQRDSAHLGDEIAARKSTLAGFTAERETTERALGDLETLAQQMRGDEDGRRALIEDYRAKIKAAEEEIAQHDAVTASLRADAEKRRAELAELAEAKLTLEGERSANDRRYRECNELLSQTQAAAGRLEQKRVTAAMEEKQILDKLWESYELSHSAAQEQRIELESVPKASRRINELKREINGLGNVNVGAIEEFDRVNTRYTYLTGQRDDVEKAKEELLGVIENITSEMTVIFKEQFALIRESFQETFLELFGGGKATLELEDENAVLDCGIEIKVQPPGKALKTLSLLSGGEKAFVAIALYFAILKVHPTPFCVMDEIEAALDEPNVIRVAHYMRRICDKTQFIVITHRRGTMEAADVLYGVTMQERGVSKVLTINMNDMAKELNIKG